MPENVNGAYFKVSTCSEWILKNIDYNIHLCKERKDLVLVWKHSTCDLIRCRRLVGVWLSSVFMWHKEKKTVVLCRAMLTQRERIAANVGDQCYKHMLQRRYLSSVMSCKSQDYNQPRDIRCPGVFVTVLGSKELNISWSCNLWRKHEEVISNALSYVQIAWWHIRWASNSTNILHIRKRV